MSWAVVRVRGSVNVKPKIKETMKLMRLNRVNHCVIILNLVFTFTDCYFTTH